MQVLLVLGGLAALIGLMSTGIGIVAWVNHSSEGIPLFAIGVVTLILGVGMLVAGFKSRGDAS